MNQAEKLRQWMKEQGYTNSTLADAMGVSYEYVYKFTARQDTVSSTFVLRFTERFGWDVAASLFAEHTEDRTPAPESVL